MKHNLHSATGAIRRTYRVSAGASRRSEIAAALARPSSALAHLVTGLADIGLIEHLDDAPSW